MFSIKKTTIFFIFLMQCSFSTYATVIKLPAQLQDYTEFVTLKNGLFAIGAGLGVYGLCKILYELKMKIDRFMTLVEQEREKQKIRDENREKKYKIAGILGKPAVTLLDRFYEAKAALGKKIALKMVARTVAGLFPATR